MRWKCFVYSNVAWAEGNPRRISQNCMSKVWQDVISCSSNVALGGCIWGEINQCMSRRCWTEHGQLQLRNTLWFPCGEIIISFYNSDIIFLLYVTFLCLYIQYCVQLFSSSLKDIGEVSGTRGWLWKSWNSSLLQRDSKGWNSSSTAEKVDREEYCWSLQIIKVVYII